jgi:hypothetical protein
MESVEIYRYMSDVYTAEKLPWQMQGVQSSYALTEVVFVKLVTKINILNKESTWSFFKTWEINQTGILEILKQM